MMQPRNMVHISAVFILFGILVLVIGSTMLMAATRRANPDDIHTVVLRICGRIACVTGGILVACILFTCLYFGLIGSQYSVFSQTDTSDRSSQLVKAMLPQSRLRLTTQTTVEKDKLPAPQPPRSIYLKGFQPSGDAMETGRDDVSGGSGLGQTNAQTGLPMRTTNWSNSTQFPCPRLGNRRRGHSADPTPIGLDYIPTLSSKLIMAPVNSLDSSINYQSPRRLWMPTLNDQKASILTPAPSTDYGAAHLIGQGSEPTGITLYSGGRVRLGDYV